MRGIIGVGGHVPHHRLDRSEVAAFFGKGGGRGQRAVASYDEDTTTMGAAAARRALASAPGVSPASLWFSTSTPAYLEKTNATTIHASLRLGPSVDALDFGGALRSGAGALRTALTAGGPTLVVAADQRDGLATSSDEVAGGDGAAAILVGDAADGPVIAEYLGCGIATDEFLERWRVPGAARSRSWEERFGEVTYGPLMTDAWEAARAATGLGVDDIDRLAVAGTHARAVSRNARRLGVADDRRIDDLSGTVGNLGTAHPLA
ncbi:MAG: hydroxymethylglutaryl-CoA synthase, partial [Acidimicrobiales bacterium]|nr:hydroxymethylglutaryl-CoA synthase [Acidimicrobiales bacterium]